MSDREFSCKFYHHLQDFQLIYMVNANHDACAANDDLSLPKGTLLHTFYFSSAARIYAVAPPTSCDYITIPFSYLLPFICLCILAHPICSPHRRGQFQNINLRFL